MLRFQNSAGFVFEWPDGSDIVEVFHPKSSTPEIPIWAEKVDIRRELGALKKFAADHPDYSVF